MIVVDASVAAKWILTEPYSDPARALLRSTLDAGENIIAPWMLPIEVTNILRQRMRREALLLHTVQELLAEFLAIPVSLHSPAGLYHRALELADQHGLPAVYDAHYVALAQLAGCVFWTDDQRLLRDLNGRLAFVRSIADYQIS